MLEGGCLPLVREGLEKRSGMDRSRKIIIIDSVNIFSISLKIFNN